MSSHVTSNIRAEMARNNTTQADVAHALGITPQAVSRRMRGAVTFNIDELDTIALLLGVDVIDLLHPPRTLRREEAS